MIAEETDGEHTIKYYVSDPEEQESKREIDSRREHLQKEADEDSRLGNPNRLLDRQILYISINTVLWSNIGLKQYLGVFFLCFRFGH